MKSYNDVANFFENDKPAKDYFNEVAGRVARDLFMNQEDWIYMNRELGEDRDPMIKSSEDFYENFRKCFNDAVGWMRECMYYALLKAYVEDDIDLPKDLAEDYNEWYGYEVGDEEYVEGKEA